ncbi:phosphopantothenoylcysteine decarboxylase [Klebsormidium nitens]|uniref:COX assembly mitochondrial protein n=1 Tax=Klebsormidium nitens TaxID=105231 RepID=A0A1Y1HY46_KLENI|nr:phosphopantothenoylcysteine decarboxylase [Klebsormidium nitens]|eukprot:GAQ80768.1 phosphopantothenoylcysteine decarboxylase [Klebsormidium nitens]
MHPPLALHKHPACKAQILALQVCHSEHPLAKFVGVCNEAKYALDKCFREEKRVNSAKNREESKRFQERLQKRREEARLEKNSVTASG